MIAVEMGGGDSWAARGEFDNHFLKWRATATGVGIFTRVVQ